MYKYALFFFAAFVITATTWSQNNLPIIFYNHPVSNSKEAGQSSFKSSEFIYGRVELGTSVKNYFKIKAVTDQLPYPYLIYSLIMNYTDKWGVKKQKENYWTSALLKDEQLEKNYMDIDVLPDPSLVTWVLSGTSNFSSGLAAAPFYHLISPEVFHKNGDVSISINISHSSQDAWGNNEPADKWPSIKGNFIFNFNEADIATLNKNKKVANENAEANAFTLSALPALFSKPYKAPDAKLSQANVLAAIKRVFPGRTILKMALESNSSAIWKIMTNDLGIPRYRYYDGVVHIAFKEEGVCWVGDLGLEEPYLGGGKYGQLKSDAGIGRDKKIDCKAIK